MKNISAFLAVFCLLLIGTQARHYAVLVAGSSAFYNYRHQADVFHAYKILIDYGVQGADIITFAYDDIASDPENPFPGQVFNKPTNGTAGEDVYDGVVIDYKGDDVTPQNFLNALTGNSTNGSKVLVSGPNDNVFIYFADHGATGLIAFPNDYLYANDFITALNTMHANNMYKQMVIYIEACESGSMFDGILPANINIYATTAANSDESSYATYCPPDDVINGTEINSCLGDLYSVNFLENLEAVNPARETLLKQFTIVKNETDQSHVQQFGDISIDKEVIGVFEGNTNTTGFVSDSLYTSIETKDGAKMSVINSRNVKLAYLERRHQKYMTAETESALFEEIESIVKFDTTFATLSKTFNLDVSSGPGKIDFDCLKERVALYEEVCDKFSDYGLQYVKYLSLSCTQGVENDDFTAAIINLCL